MDKFELRARFDKEISAPDKELLWEWLEDEHYVSEVCQGDLDWPEFKAMACHLADRQWKLLGRTKPLGRTRRASFLDLFTIEIGLTDSEEEHAAALAPYLAKRAALLPEVQAFREQKLGGDTLEPKQVVTFLRTELRYLPKEEYADVEWALAQAPEYPIGAEEEEIKDLVGGWQNRSRKSKYGHYTENVRRAVEFDSMAAEYEPSSEFLYGLMHLIRDETGGTLEDLGRRLLLRYPWPLRDAVWFVLTGEMPEIEPLKIQYDKANGTYRVTFAPWISEKTISRTYRSLQVKDNRPLGNRSLAWFRFVEEHTEPGQTPRWEELTTLWNKLHPDDKIGHRSTLRKAYERAKERLASPWVNEQGQAVEEVDIF